MARSQYLVYNTDLKGDEAKLTGLALQKAVFLSGVVLYT